MLPSLFGESLFDEFFDDAFAMAPAFHGRDPLYGRHAKNLMKADVREVGQNYELDIDLPGFQKDEIGVELQNGCLTIRAAKGLDKSETGEDGRYIRQERYAGVCSRSFYVGDAVRPEDIHAKYEGGVLRLCIPKEEKPQLPDHTTISIE